MPLCLSGYIFFSFILNNDLRKRSNLQINCNSDKFDIVKQSENDLLPLLNAYRQAIDESLISAITDTKGTIIHVNKKFCEITKYSTDELVGQNHRIINSGYHPKGFWKNMWIRQFR